MADVGPWPGPARASFPVYVALRSIGVPFVTWREQALRLEAAGYAGVACWDHFVSRGDRRDSVLEAWTTLAAVGAATTRLGLLPFVLNVMNRHPAVLARMAATLQDVTAGRLVLGIGIGGHPAEHAAYGIPFPGVAERVARLEEAVAVLRALWSGGPATRESPFYPLADAYAAPVPVPPIPIVIGAESPGGARLAARIGDGWTTPAPRLGSCRSAWEDGLAASGRDRATQRVLVAFDLRKGESLAGSEWTTRPAEAIARWRLAGADGAVVEARSVQDVDRLVAAADLR